MAEAAENRPTTYTAFTEQVGKLIVEQIERAQQTQIDGVSRFRDAMSQWLPRSPGVNLPWLQNLPSQQTIAKANYKLAQQLLDAQHRYAIRLLDSLSPAEEGSTE